MPANTGVRINDQWRCVSSGRLRGTGSGRNRRLPLSLLCLRDKCAPFTPAKSCAEFSRPAWNECQRAGDGAACAGAADQRHRARATGRVADTALRWPVSLIPALSHGSICQTAYDLKLAEQAAERIGSPSRFARCRMRRRRLPVQHKAIGTRPISPAILGPLSARLRRCLVAPVDPAECAAACHPSAATTGRRVSSGEMPLLSGLVARYAGADRRCPRSRHVLMTNHVPCCCRPVRPMVPRR